MAAPTTAQRSVTIEASREAVYDLVTDVTRMGEWSPECVRCEWLDAPGATGSTFRGHNRNGLARWTTTARVLVADRPREFTFATVHGEKLGTRWSYRLADDGPGRTVVIESFEAMWAPPLIRFAERFFIRNRQAKLEHDMAATLGRIKAVAERA